MRGSRSTVQQYGGECYFLDPRTIKGDKWQKRLAIIIFTVYLENSSVI